MTETRDTADRYTVLGASERRTFANWLTPIGEHFVCHRNDMPVLEADEWSLSLTGEIDGTLSMADLKSAYPTVAVAHTMECAGNGRGHHQPETGSVQWGFEAAATAFWTGTPVRSILRDHGVTDADERWLTAVGGDRSADDDVFARSIPLEKALTDCLLAYEMNGHPLPREHGYPLRLIVPGWYGVNNVKWVEELRVMDSMVDAESLERPGEHGVWQQEAYRLHPPGVSPEANETVPTGDTRDQLEDGVTYPYTFDANVMSVIGIPDGTAELTVELEKTVEVRGVAWRLFRYEWDATPGRHTVLSRATDDRGRTQPARISEPGAWREGLEGEDETEAFPWNEGGYAANAYEPNGVAVVVEQET